MAVNRATLIELPPKDMHSPSRLGILSLWNYFLATRGQKKQADPPDTIINLIAFLTRAAQLSWADFNNFVILFTTTYSALSSTAQQCYRGIYRKTI